MLPGVQQFQLRSRSAIITGGSRGLGEAIAAGLASAGAELMLVSRKGDESVRTAANIARDFGTRALGFQADITSPEQVQQMVETAHREFGKIDILINNAGINIRGPIEELSLDQFHQVMATNVTGCWLCCQAVVPLMKQRKYGRIINVASALGLVGLPGRTPYASSKGAVVQMTRALSLELAPHQITVNAICPGPFLTEMNAAIAETEEAKRLIVGATALKRWGRLEEIQGAALFLASDASSYCTGSMLSVDGGWTAQ